jgi:DNA-binding response OmpR family regulator
VRELRLAEAATTRSLRSLLLEDDAETRQFLVSLLVEMGLEVAPTRTMKDAHGLRRHQHFDLVVVDRMLPDGSGLDFVRALRSDGNLVPVLVLTALKEVGERVKGLEAGADDYLGKPFAPLELKARVRALLRRGATRPREIDRGPLRLDCERRRALVDGKELPLTAREFLVLELIVAALALSRDEILEAVWGESTAEASSSLDVILSRLRKKLGERGVHGIETIRGYGYRWKVS